MSHTTKEGTSLAILSLDLSNLVSGETRFAINLARGLSGLGLKVTVCAATCHQGTAKIIESLGIKVVDLGLSERSYAAKTALVTNVASEAKDLGTIARESNSDWYVVLSDALLPSIEVLPHNRAVYISQGDLSLMFLNPAFYRRYATLKLALSVGASTWLMSRSRRAGQFRALYANSNFARGIMSYLYGVPFSGVVYPPVDTDFFTPSERTNVRDFVLALARNEMEQGIEILSEVAQEQPLKVVGGAKIPHAESIGRVSDEELRNLYADALYVISPAVSEFYGYSVAEALSCGTPVLAFNVGGPAEQISDGESGWLANSVDEMRALSKTITRDGVPPTMRAAARKSAMRRSLRASGQALVDLLARLL